MERLCMDCGMPLDTAETNGLKFSKEVTHGLDDYCYLRRLVDNLENCYNSFKLGEFSESEYKAKRSLVKNEMAKILEGMKY